MIGWQGLASALGLVAAGLLMAAAARAELPFGQALVAEARSQSLCESVRERVFVRHRLGSDCIAYYVTEGPGGGGATILYFDGDVSPDEFKSPQIMAAWRQNAHEFLRHQSNQLGVRIIYVARPGLFGSSGNQLHRRKLVEMLSMEAAVDGLQKRLAIGRLALVGQSGGATIAAFLLSSGRTDIRCAALGSGLLSVGEGLARSDLRNLDGRAFTVESARAQFFDPIAHIKSIPHTAERSVYIVGDPADAQVPYDLQESYATALRGAQHHAVAIRVKGSGRHAHGTSHATLPAAALCMRGASDDDIRRTLQR